METTFEINFWQYLLVLISVFLIYIKAYNTLSDPKEKSEGKVYSLKTFWSNNLMNFLGSLISGIILMIVMSEVGIDIVLKQLLNIDIPNLGDTTLDFTTAILGGFLGDKLADKFLTKK